MDDGPSDNSLEIIARYGDNIHSIVKENGRQSSAFNAGFAVSQGEVVLFLYSDDILLPTALERAVPFFDDVEIVKGHWPLWVIDMNGRKNSRVWPPGATLSEGDLRNEASDQALPITAVHPA